MRRTCVCVLLLVVTGCATLPLSRETLNGEWRFAYVQKWRSMFGENPTPPSFDTIEFKPGGNIRLKDTLMRREFAGSYSLDGDKLTWTFSPPDVKTPVVHRLECSWTSYGRGLMIRAAAGTDETEFVYCRSQRFLPAKDIAGTWVVAADGKSASMTFGKDGEYGMGSKDVWGYYRLWQSDKGNALTTVMWIQGEGGFLMIYLYRVHGDELTLTPLGGNGPNASRTMTLQRAPETAAGPQPPKTP